MKFHLTILGSSSATPTSDRYPSSQILNISDKLYLVDCGEATQIQLRRYKFKIQKINHIFISHLHGDHYLGITGLLSTMSILGRTTTLHIYSSHLLKDIIDLQIKISDIHLGYALEYHFLKYDASELLLTDKNTSIYSFPLTHRIPTCGFLFINSVKEKNIIREFLQKEQLTFDEIKKIKVGEDYITGDGRIIKNQDITMAKSKPVSYAYCADTMYDESVVPYITGVDLLYHEATFMHNMSDAAREKQHSTTIDAANIALKANVKQLIIGHYSARYTELEPILKEAQSVFANTILAIEGKTYYLSD